MISDSCVILGLRFAHAIPAILVENSCFIDAGVLLYCRHRRISKARDFQLYAKVGPDKGVAGPDSGTRGSGRGGGDRFGGKKSLTSYLWCHVTKSSSLLAISRVKADDPRANPLCVTTVDSGLTE